MSTYRARPDMQGMVGRKRCLLLFTATVMTISTAFGVQQVWLQRPDSALTSPAAQSLGWTPRRGVVRLIQPRGAPYQPPARLSARPPSLPPVARRSPWSLPPIVALRVNPNAIAGRRWLQRHVLASKRLALSPNARRAIKRGRVSRGALALLLTKPRTGSPLLVFSAVGSRLRVQEPTLSGTQKLLDRLSRLTGRQAPRQVLLISMRADAVDLKGTRLMGTAAMRRGEVAVRAALQWVGVPYSWGGGDAFGPTRGFCGPAGCQGLSTVGFDCSGLTLYAWARAGVLLPHYTGSQFKAGTRITRVDDLLPGDLLFFHDDLGHMGMYIGDGRMIHAPQTGDVVRIVELAGSRYEASFRGAVRPGV